MLTRKWNFGSHMLKFLCQNVEERVAEGLNEIFTGIIYVHESKQFFKILNFGFLHLPV
jgi:hypothetical protein